MNIKFTALALVAVTALAFTPKPAVAGDRGLAVVSGLIGGLIIGSAIADHHDNRAVHVSYRYDEFGNRCDDGGNSGYWNTVSVNVWVPGYWVEERSHHGRCHRYFVAGHYEYRNSRVWVAHNRHDRYDRWDDRHDRDIGRGYGNNRYDRRDRDNDRDYDHDRRDRRR